MSVALIVDSVWSISVWGPLKDSWLAWKLKSFFYIFHRFLYVRFTFLAVETKRSLVSTKGREKVSWLSRILFPFTKPPCCSWNSSTKPGLFHSSQHTYFPSFSVRLELVPSLRVVCDVEWVVPGCELLVVAPLHNKGVGLAPHNIYFRNEQPVDIPRDAPPYVPRDGRVTVVSTSWSNLGYRYTQGVPKRVTRLPSNDR